MTYALFKEIPTFLHDSTSEASDLNKLIKFKNGAHIVKSYEFSSFIMVSKA